MQNPSDPAQSLFDTPRKAAGWWPLAAGHAITLHPDTAGELRIGQGCVWLTLDGPHERRAGDLFLEAGASLPIAAGQRVVLEPLPVPGRGRPPLTGGPPWCPKAGRQRWLSRRRTCVWQPVPRGLLCVPPRAPLSGWALACWAWCQQLSDLLRIG